VIGFFLNYQHSGIVEFDVRVFVESQEAFLDKFIAREKEIDSLSLIFDTAFVNILHEY